MSDFDDELLGLLDDQPAKKKKSSKKSKKSSSGALPAESKKRKRAAKDAGGGSDMDLSDGSSDAEPPPRHQRAQSNDIVVDPPSDEETYVNPYPLEGKYVDQQDKAKLMSMSELDRESILETRQVEVDKVRDRLQVRQMAKQIGNQHSQREDPTKRSSRAIKATGITETKSKGLEKLKQTREKKKRRAERGSDSEDSIAGKRRSFSSDDESEEGEVGSGDDRKRGKRGKKRIEKEPAGQADLMRILLPRRKLAEFWPKPWFAEFVKGAWVRFSVGPDPDTKEIQYRLCEVTGLAPEAKIPYPLEKHKTDILLEIRHGQDKKIARMDLVSNSEFTQKEYSRLNNTMTNLGLAMPSRESALKKAEEIEKRKGETLTEADTQIILAKKGVNPKHQNPILYKATLTSRIDAARATGDENLLAELEKDMADLNGGSARPSAPPSGATTPTKTGAATPIPTPEKGANMSTLNARNKKLNREEIRRAEIAAQDLRKKQAADGSVKVDPSARVRTTVRVMHDVRAATPDVIDKATAVLNADTTTVPTSSKQASKIEDIAGSMDLDLGDF